MKPQKQEDLLCLNYLFGHQKYKKTLFVFYNPSRMDSFCA